MRGLIKIIDLEKNAAVLLIVAVAHTKALMCLGFRQTTDLNPDTQGRPELCRCALSVDDATTVEMVGPGLDGNQSFLRTRESGNHGKASGDWLIANASIPIAIGGVRNDLPYLDRGRLTIQGLHMLVGLVRVLLSGGCYAASNIDVSPRSTVDGNASIQSFVC